MNHSFRKVGLSFVVLILTLAVIVQGANAALTLRNVKTWYWAGNTTVNSVASGDIDGDGKAEIVTGGVYYDGSQGVSQLCVWSGTTLSLKNVRTWYWQGSTAINSVVVGDVDGDSKVEIVTGGCYYDGTRLVAQLCVWNGASLSLENVKTWHWLGNTDLYSIAIGDVNGDARKEIITGGYYQDGTREVAQLIIWDGATLSLKSVKTWYWIRDTVIRSVSFGDVDADGKAEIVTGGSYSDGTQEVAQLCVWNGASLSLENVKTWHWNGGAYIYSVAIADVDSDGTLEIVTGGICWDFLAVSQLCVWSGTTLSLKNVRTWYWTVGTYVFSVAVEDLDGDGGKEIVTGGHCGDGYRTISQFCVWDAATLALETVRTWYWTDDTEISSVAVGDVNGDGAKEIINGGCYYDHTRTVAQLCVWG